MNLGMFLPTMAPLHGSPGDVAASARHAETLGYESVWAVDQLIAGAGVPLVDSTIALAAAAGSTTTIRLGYGVMILPLRPVVWAAKQVASLQHVSGDRVVLGVGVGGDRHDRSWAAVGVPKAARGALTDAALELLPALISGKSIDVDGSPVQLSPGAVVPHILVGGTAEAALGRTVAHGDGWFGMPLPPDLVAATVERLRTLADEAGRDAPSVTGSIVVALDGDPSLPGPADIERSLTDPDGMFGIPAEAVPLMVVRSAAQLSDRLGGWRDLGAERVVITVGSGDWDQQAALVAEVAGLTVR